MTKVSCDRQDCKHWVSGECSKEAIEIAERTIPPNEEIAYCKNYEIVKGTC